MKKSVFILGLGQIGAPIAIKLKNLGYHVVGTKTRPDQSAQVKVIPFQYPAPMPCNPRQYDYIISTITASQEMLDFHLQFFAQCSKEAKLFAFSSTSVFSDEQLNVDEQSIPAPKTDKAKMMAKYESELLRHFPNLCIIRPGGFLSDQKHPVRTLCHSPALHDGDLYVNLVHKEDVIEAIIFMVENEKFAPIVNIVSPEHPTKKEFYQAEAIRLNLPQPNYISTSQIRAKKRVHSTVLRDWGFQFRALKSPHDETI